jgi:Fic family protein
MSETQLSPRQSFILNIVNGENGIGRIEIEKQVSRLYSASKPTISRDLALLVKKKMVKVKGRSVSTVYLPFEKNPLLNYLDLEQYFSLEPDQRSGAKKRFDFSVFSHLKGLFGKEEIAALEQKNRGFEEATSKLDQSICQRELERFVIELSWKSSKIEGNTYSLLETETLIKESIEASGHSKAEAIMILNHKKAFESILMGRKDYVHIGLSKILELHASLVKDLSITLGLREQPVGITGTVYKPLDNKWQISEALEKLSLVINKTKFPLEKALIASTMISYIQPFSDGNKRTARMIANAILLAHDFFPLSYRSVEEDTYKKALILFYEKGSIHHLKHIFIDQYQFALDTYFHTHADYKAE